MFYMLTLLFLFCGNICYAGTISPSGDDSKHIEYGSKFKCVLKISGEYQNNDQFFASSVAIKDTWVLTAAHIVQKYKYCFIHYNNKRYSIHKIMQHPDFDNNKFDYNDIALLQLNEGLNLESYPELYMNDDESGKLCDISGFGLAGTFKTGFYKTDNNRRAGSNIIDKIEKNLLICSPSYDDNKTELEFLIAGGDSGGGLFIGHKLAGINSCLFTADKKNDASYGDESGHTRISYHTKWIESTIKEVENAQKKK